MRPPGVEEGLVTLAGSGSCMVLVGDRTVRCRLRGRLRKGEERILTGDRVRVSVFEDGTGIIEELLPRQSELARPPIANVDHAVIMATLNQPALNSSLLDRLLVLAEYEDLLITVCINKVDIACASKVEDLTSTYRQVGYPVVLTSAITGSGVDDLIPILNGRISVIAGETGTGKSTLLNRLIPGAGLRVGEVDPRAGRGRHTTRHVKLLDLPGGGRVADSPGFMRVDLQGLYREEIALCFPEVRSLARDCRFSNCLHLNEPDCAVRDALASGTVASSRYQNYRVFVEEAVKWEEDKHR